MVNDTTTLNGALMELGEVMASNLTLRGITSNASEGLTTLAKKINIEVYDKGVTGDKSDRWVIGSAVTETVDNTGTTLSVVSATVSSGYNVSTIPLHNDFEAIVYIENNGTGNTSRARFGVTDGTNRSFIQSTTHYFKFSRINGVYSGAVSTDGESWMNQTLQSDTASGTSDVYCIIGIYASSTTVRTMKYKDLRIYKK